MWLNFSRFVTDDFFVYWPAILIGISAIVIFNPIPLVYHHSRFWFIRSNVSGTIPNLYQRALTPNSGGYLSQGSSPSSFVISFWATCTARKLMR